MGAITATYSTTTTGRTAVLVVSASGFAPHGCASAHAVWPDGHSASYAEPCPE